MRFVTRFECPRANGGGAARADGGLDFVRAEARARTEAQGWLRGLYACVMAHDVEGARETDVRRGAGRREGPNEISAGARTVGWSVQYFFFPLALPLLPGYRSCPFFSA